MDIEVARSWQASTITRSNLRWSSKLKTKLPVLNTTQEINNYMSSASAFMIVFAISTTIITIMVMEIRS